MVVAWLLVGAVLVLFEMHHLAFYALFGAIGAFAAAAVAVAAPGAIALQGLVAVVVAIVGVVAARPWVSRVFHRHSSSDVVRGVHGGLVGQEAVTIDEVGDLDRLGHVRLAGERWLAASDGLRIPPGTPVVITAVRGTTLFVWPVE